MRREPEYLSDTESVLLYIARRLKEALALEEALTSAGIDYVVEVDQYVGGFVFQRARAGAFFYVRPESADAARHTMRARGFNPYEPQKGSA